MNCLFVNLHEPVENSGGIETVTGILSAEFSENYNINTYCLWQLSGAKDAQRYSFQESKSLSNLSASDIVALLKEWDINLIIVQAYNEYVPIMRAAIKSSNLAIKLIYVLHSNPGWEFMISKWSNVRKLPKRQGLRGLIKVLVYPLFRYYHNKKTKNTYVRNYKLCDKIVLLSPNYIPEYKNKFDIRDGSKLYAITNPCLFTNGNNALKLQAISKKKNVLIVGRLLEFQKRISYALNIWSEIEKDSRFNDWNLIIVGYGSDEDKYRRYIDHHNIRRVKMIGKQDPKQFYIDSSIFIMTSAFEGLALTLIEAQNFGCVPIAFDSFSSLSDIISNGKNGIIIPNNDINGYILNLKNLMSDTSYRNQLMNNSIKDVTHFSVESVAKAWIALFRELNLLPYN